jgi:hypothetical protein
MIARNTPTVQPPAFVRPEEKALAEKKINSLVCMADIEPTEVSWLWEPYLPLGKITILRGDPGTGKNNVYVDIGFYRIERNFFFGK